MSSPVPQPEAAGRDLRWGDRRLSGATVWLTGLSGSGKSTIAGALALRLLEQGRAGYVLDADNLRLGLNQDLDFSESGRRENVRRVGEVAKLLADAGLVAIVPIISPYQSARAEVRATHQAAGLPFLEVHVAATLETCETRDPKGLYRRARAGEFTGMTGIDSPYEEPESPDLRIDENVDLHHAVALIVGRLGA